MVKSLSQVLLAIGPNDRTHVDELLDTVEAVAGPADATVFLLHVFEREEYNDLMSEMSLDATVNTVQPDELATRHENVQTPAARLEEAGIDFEIRGTVGEPDTEVVRVAEDIGIDLLFIGGGGQTPTKKAIFGDDAQQILLKAPCPVTYVQRRS